jgi:DNA-directed RNA polymerase specialized sigma24 family protein
MAELPHPWDAYRRLQDELHLTNAVTTESWGLEAALDGIAAAVENGEAITTDDVRLFRETASRRERRHLVLIGKLAPLVSAASQAEGPLAAVALAKVKASLPAREWQLLSDVGAGWSYAEIARREGRRAGALRVRVQRMRAQLRTAGRVTGTNAAAAKRPS